MVNTGGLMTAGLSLRKDILVASLPFGWNVKFPFIDSVELRFPVRKIYKDLVYISTSSKTSNDREVDLTYDKS